MAQLQAIQGDPALATAQFVEDERVVRMVEHEIGRAQCSFVYECKTHGCYYKGGVVRIGDENVVIVVQVANKSIRRVVAPHNHPGKIKNHPTFSAYRFAPLEEAKKIVSGEIPTRRYQGQSLRPTDGTGA